DLFFLLDNNDLLLDTPFPVYVLNRGNDMSRLDFCNTLMMDNHAEGMKMISALHDSGFRRVICLCGADSLSSEREYWCVRRYEGMARGLLTFRDRQCRLEKAATVGEPDFLDLLRDRGSMENTVFVGMNCLLAARFIDYAADRGFRAGKDYNITAFDDHSLFRSYDLTALKVPVREVGEIFADMVTADAWYKKYPLRISLSLCGDWVERSSCRKLTIAR
ncbi:MAG: LacI family DNA-binding transcriptional regulator, partial [Lentisphaeria bacterium]|nr:LacI family DNA-binding transcriptional regulator [Lentisphaeria bacterium]